MTEKRGRKPKTKPYFGPPEEAAVVKYLSLGELVQHPDYPDDNNRKIWVGTREESIEREMIYNKWLRKPLITMAESLIRKYGLYRKGVTFENHHADTLSFLMLKVDKFKPEKGKKAYSYYGTICKHYMMGKLIDDTKRQNKLHSYEDFSTSIEEQEEYSYLIDSKDFSFNVFIQNLIDGIEEEVNDADAGIKKKLSENERKVAYSLVDILSSWEIILDDMNGGRKFNKNSVLQSMRNYTNLTTKDIRMAMKRFKVLYELVKTDGLDSGLYDDEDDENQ